MNSPSDNSKASDLTSRLFKAIEKMSDEQKQELLVLVGDQRKYTRIPYLMGVSYKTSEADYKDFILDIGPGGTFIETNEDFFTGQELSLKFNFKEEADPFEITGCVVWQSSNGVGVKFIFETANQQKKLKDILSKL